MNSTVDQLLSTPLAINIESPGSSVFDLPIQTPQASYPARATARARRLDADAHNTDAAQTASFIVISGGTGGNSFCSAFTNACYVLPVSDDGGSSSEIIRVLGGPSVGT